MNKRGDTYIDDNGWYCIFTVDSDYYLGDYEYSIVLCYIEIDMGLKSNKDYKYGGGVGIFCFREESDLVAFKLGWI